jgi:TPR repeat protein
LELLERGDVDAARKFFERAADQGLSQAAMALATTYDPNELAKLKVVGLQGNAIAARKWYDRAAQLGATEAGERLRRLGAR